MSAAAAAREREGVQERGGGRAGRMESSRGGVAKERCRRRAEPAYCGLLRVFAACYGLLRPIEAFSGFLYQALIAEARRHRDAAADARRPASAGRRRRLRRAPRSASHCGLLRFIAA